MEIISGTKDFYINSPTAVAIGKFDGVHVGHQKLLLEITEPLNGKKTPGIKSCVFTFDPAPSVYFGAENALLTTVREKRILFERKGVDILIEYPFDRETADTSPADFLNLIITGRAGAVMIAAGSDLSFGKNGEGNAQLLREYASLNNIDVRIIDKIRVSLDEEYEVSSTLIRRMISEARMEEAERLLGIPYFVYGQIVHGNHIGTELGFPTINILPDADKLLPPFGVYLSDVIINGGKYKGLTNIGRKPTVSDSGRVGVETYIYDFDEDVYGKYIEVRLLEFMRPEMKFEGVEQLKDQIHTDIEEARN